MVSGSLSDSTDVTVANGATYALGSNDTIGSLAGDGDVSLGSYTLVSGQSGASTTFSGAISGSGLQEDRSWSTDVQWCQQLHR